MSPHNFFSLKKVERPNAKQTSIWLTRNLQYEYTENTHQAMHCLYKQ